MGVFTRLVQDLGSMVQCLWIPFCSLPTARGHDFIRLRRTSDYAVLGCPVGALTDLGRKSVAVALERQSYLILERGPALWLALRLLPKVRPPFSFKVVSSGIGANFCHSPVRSQPGPH